MKIGTYYYPEQWPRHQWERDFDRMAAMGLQIVHIGEFAWATMEPREGDYQLDWIAECLEMAAKRKMAVILCTPTAVLPIWMIDKHPDALMSHKRFGGRRHGNHLNPVVLDYTAKIVTALADRFGDHPSVIGWQIDNELSSSGYDQGPITHAAFQAWLKDKYGTLEKLNAAWGTQFWNTYYTDYAQIRMASAPASSTYANPHHYLDAARFWSWSFAYYAKLQANILKPKVGNRWITTNFMPFHPDINPGELADTLSLFSWDAYPVSGFDKNPKDQTFRMASPGSLGFTHDQMASYTGRWGLMELQPGQINWSGFPVLVYPGAVRLWVWTAFAHGAEFVTTYRFRQPLWSVEQWHHGLIGTDGVTPSQGGREFMQTITEMVKLDLAKVPPHEKDLTDDNTVGLLFDFDQLWGFTVQPQAKSWSQTWFLQLWYAAIMRLGLNVRILHPNQPWPAGLKMIVAPGLQMVDDAIVKRMDDYAAAGGNLVLTCRTGIMNKHGHFWEGDIGKPILPLIGAHIEAYDSLPDGTIGKVELLDSGKFGWHIWADLLYAEAGTKVLARYGDQFYSGAIAATQKKHGQGSVTYSGVFGDQAYHDALVEKIAKQIKLATVALPDRVCVYRRGPYSVCLNYNDHSITAPAPRDARFLVGSSKIDPAGVAVWE